MIYKFIYVNCSSVAEIKDERMTKRFGSDVIGLITGK